MKREDERRQERRERVGRGVRAIVIGVAALAWAGSGASCGGKRGEALSREEARIAADSIAGQTALARGQLELAEMLFGRALAAARAADDAGAIAAAAYNTAAVKVERGEHAGALALLRESEAESERAGLSDDEAKLLRARAMFASGEEEAGEGVAEGLAGSGDAGVRAQAAILRAQRAMRVGRMDEAAELVDAAGRDAEESGDVVVRGRYLSALGELKRWKGEAAAAGAEFEAAAEGFAAASARRLMVEALLSAAEQHEAGGGGGGEGTGRAAWCLYRAARSEIGAGAEDGAKIRGMLRRARGLAERAGRDDLVRACDGLKEEIEETAAGAGEERRGG